MAAGLRAQLLTIYRAATPANRRRFHLLLGLTPLAALAEMATVGAVVPLLALLAGSAAPSWLDHRVSGPGMTLAAAGLFVAAALLAAALRVLLGWSGQRFAFSLGHELAVEIQRRVLHQPYLFHASRNSSAIISSLDKVELLTFNVIFQLIQTSSALIMALFIMAALLSIAPVSAALAAMLVLARN